MGLSLLVPIGVNAQKVKTEYDKTVDFSKYKTYAWQQGQGARNELINQMILAAVELQLAAKGFTKVTENPDVHVAYMAAVGMDMQVAQTSWGNSALPVFMNVTTVGQTWEVHTGTLLVDLFDSASNRMIWRGAARETLSQGPTNNAAADAKRVEKPVKKAVEKMFKKFPTQR